MNQGLIEGFVRDLRRRGLRVSPAERIDAERALLCVGVESRSRFRAALGATLAKTPEERALFDSAFEKWFVPPRPSRRRGQRGRRREPGEDGPGGRGGSGTGGGRLAPARDEEPPPGGPRAGRSRPESRRSPAGEPSPRLRRGTRLCRVVARRDLRGPARRRERAAPEARRPGAAPPSRRRDLIQPWTREEEERLASEIAAVIREIRLGKGRRYRKGSRGRLWVKKMIRESLAHGGVPFSLPMKQRRPRRPRVVLLVDVSRSVARAAGLFLLICRGLAGALGRIALLLFVDRTVEATQLARRWSSGRREDPFPSRTGRRPPPGAGIRPRPGMQSFADLVAALPSLDPGAASDYGRAFYQARSAVRSVPSRDSVLVVLGDARTNRRDPQSWAFEEIASRCRRVIWLNPEPRDQWDTGDSVMHEYMAHCDVACEVRDLEGLALGVREILRGL